MPTIQTFTALEADPTATVFPGEEPRTIRLDLPAGEAIPAHSHPDREIVFYVLAGAFDHTIDDESYAVEAGEIVRFSGEREVSPEAREDATALLVLAQT